MRERERAREERRWRESRCRRGPWRSRSARGSRRCRSHVRGWRDDEARRRGGWSRFCSRRRRSSRSGGSSRWNTPFWSERQRSGRQRSSKRLVSGSRWRRRSVHHKDACPALRVGDRLAISISDASVRSQGRRQTGDEMNGTLADSEDHGSTLFVDNVSRAVDVRALRWLLRMDAFIVRIFISRKRRPNNKLGFAFVKMSSSSHVKQAVGKIHGRVFMGYKLYARQAKYEMKYSSDGVRSMSTQKGSTTKPAAQINPPVSDKHTQASSGDRVVPGDAGVLSPDCGDGLIGGACMEEGGAQGSGSGSRDGQQKILICVRCCCRLSCSLPEESSPCSKEEKASPCSKEEKAKAKVESFNYVSDTNGGYSVGGLSNGFWSGVPYSSSSLWHPVVGYWVGYPTHGFDQPGWWGQPQGWGLWPFYSSAGYYQAACVQQPPPPTPPNVQNSNDDVNRNPCQGTMGTDDRVPVSIRQPFSVKGSGPDPVMEDIVNKTKGGMEEDAQCFDKLSNDVDAGFDLGHNGNGSGDLGLWPGSESGGPQAQVLEEDLEDVGLRSLFEEPEFPPGFEPAGPSKQEDDPDADLEETIVKEEARQTLIFAKQLGCTVPNEKLALSNFEEIIQKQRTSLRRRGQVENDESIEESDRCSRSTANDKGKRARRTGPLGFSKFSQVSKVAMRCKKKAK